MEIVINLTDAQVEALESFLSTQVEQITNPVSGNVSIKPRFASVSDFVLFQTGVYVSNAMETFPPLSVQADLLAIKEAKARIADLAKPSIVQPTIEPTKK
jgi:hypothetical protein